MLKITKPLIQFLVEIKKKNIAPPGGLEPPTFRLTAERASQLRHGGKLLYANNIDDLAWLLLYIIKPKRKHFF